MEGKSGLATFLIRCFSSFFWKEIICLENLRLQIATYVHKGRDLWSCLPCRGNSPQYLSQFWCCVGTIVSHHKNKTNFVEIVVRAKHYLFITGAYIKVVAYLVCALFFLKVSHVQGASRKKKTKSGNYFRKQYFFVYLISLLAWIKIYLYDTNCELRVFYFVKISIALLLMRLT